MSNYSLVLDFAVNNKYTKGIIARLGDKDVTVDLYPYLNGVKMNTTGGLFTISATTPSGKEVKLTQTSVTPDKVVFTLDNTFILEVGFYENAHISYENDDVKYSTQDFTLFVMPLSDI